MSQFFKWDIIYTSKFPESIQCGGCKNFFMPCKSSCECGYENNISNIVDKIRPILLWIDKNNWRDSMAFAILLSASRILENDYNEPIYLSDYKFKHKNNIYNRPMRAMIHQSTRIDGNILKKDKIIGKLTNLVKMRKIEDKLFNWMFGDKR
jgi:hypothetical protein